VTKKNRKTKAGQGAVQHQGGVMQGENSSPAPVIPPEKKPSSRAVKSDVLPLLLTCADVCALLNISRSTLFRLEKSGEVPGRVTIGGQVRYHRQVIEEWLLEQARGQEGKGNDTM
jgi:excisionase family DNA binding protein